jgi:hypothetical protein
MEGVYAPTEIKPFFIKACPFSLFQKKKAFVKRDNTYLIITNAFQ